MLFSHYNGHFSVSNGWVTLLALLAIWELVWKLIALWRAGRNNQLGWFLAVGILNTAGILEIIYLIFFQKDNSSSK